MNLLNTSAKEILKKLIRFPSLSMEEKELVDWVEQAVRQTGLLEIERHGDNLLFHLGSGRPWLLLNTHSDVVPPSANHVGDPFDPVEKDGRIYGRGSTDAKGCGTAMLKAMLELAASGFPDNLKDESKNPVPGRVTLALTVCEEAAGVNNGMDYLRDIIEKPDAALIGEPTSLAPCVAQKGLYILKIMTEGESGHAARITGKNALYEMSGVLEILKAIHFEEENAFIGKTKITPTMISGGTAKNAHPEYCEVIVDIRTIPEVPVQAIRERLEKELANLKVKIETISDRFITTQTPVDEKIARAARKVSGKEFFGSPTASDWVFLSDVPAVKIGPGHSECSHTADEYIETEQLEKGVELYKGIIRSWFELK